MSYRQQLDNAEAVYSTAKDAEVQKLARQLKIGILRAWLASEENNTGMALNGAELENLRTHRDKIKTIKMYRDRTGFGLRESKDAVEQAMLDIGIGYRHGSGGIYFC